MALRHVQTSNSSVTTLSSKLRTQKESQQVCERSIQWLTTTQDFLNAFPNVFYLTVLKLGATRVLNRIEDVFFPNRPNNVQCDEGLWNWAVWLRTFFFLVIRLSFFFSLITVLCWNLLINTRSNSSVFLSLCRNTSQSNDEHVKRKMPWLEIECATIFCLSQTTEHPVGDNVGEKSPSCLLNTDRA